jgi:hypothetical protein
MDDRIATLQLRVHALRRDHTASQIRYTGRAELSAPGAPARRHALKVKLDGSVAREWTITSESGQTPAVTTASVGSMAARWFYG